MRMKRMRSCPFSRPSVESVKSVVEASQRRTEFLPGASLKAAERPLRAPGSRPGAKARIPNQPLLAVQDTVAHNSDHTQNGAEVLAPNERNERNERKSCVVDRESTLDRPP